jgi:hypothetical protein
MIPFDVISSGNVLVVTPSTGMSRRVTQSDFNRHWEMAAAYTAGTEWRRTTRNSSYLEASAHDMAGPPGVTAPPPPSRVALPDDDSAEQRGAEALILSAVSAQLGIELVPGRLTVDDSIRVDVDGLSHDPPVLVEAWAHQGPPKPAQKAKVMADAFKLVWIERRLFPRGARKIVAFADPSAAGHFTGRTWMAAALRELGIEVLVVELPADIRAGIRAAQARQVR